MDPWFDRWLNGVQNGRIAMSQRARTSIDAHGGLEAAIEAAKVKGVHLVELTDDTGKHLIAASRHPFRALC